MRYIILIILNLPIIFLALANIITDYKLKKVSINRFRNQIVLWVFILVVVIGSFPIYNIATGSPPLDSSELSLFDIVQTTVIVYLIYIINGHRQKTDRQERKLRDLHQEISIKITENKDHV